MALDEDTRHSDRNADARQRAADQLRPAVRKVFAEILEIDEDELPLAREAIKELMRARRLRQERTEKAVSEMIVSTLKWLGGIGAGLLGGWWYAHKGGG